MASNKALTGKGDTMTAEQVKKAWKTWQASNPAEASEVKETFCGMTLDGNWEDAESYLCHVVEEKTGASFEAVLDALA